MVDVCLNRLFLWLSTSTADVWVEFSAEFVCLSDFLHYISKNDAARITELDMFHDVSWKTIYFGIERSKVKSHKNTAGKGRSTLVSAGFFWFHVAVHNNNYKNKNWLQFLFIVKAAVLKQQISKFYPQIQRTEASDHIYFSQRPFINVKAIFCT